MALARYTGVAQDAEGNALGGATVTVRSQRSGKPLAALKSNRAGTSPKDNPFNAESNGSFFFHAVGDVYEITVSKNGDTFSREYVGIGTASEYDLDALLIGKRQQVRVATTGNIDIATALNNGDALNGVTLVTNDLALVWQQNNKAENGIYKVGAIPVRYVEFDTYDKHAGAMIAVTSGAAYAKAVFFCSANAGGMLGTTAIDFTELAATAGPPGEPGPPGPATIAIGTVTTLGAGEPATVTNSGDAENVILNFGIPEGNSGAPGADGILQSVVGGTNITVDNTDPANPVISSSGGGIESIVAGANITVDNTDPKNPIISSAVPEGGPIVLLASGQSNISMYQTYSWTPPTNLFLWDFDGQVDAPTVTGTAFDPMTNANMAVAYSFGAKIAESNPSRPVYVVNIGNGGQPISKWLTGSPSPSPDMYACVKNNIEAALTAIGAAQIDLFLWWQGEADAVLDTVTYATDFATLLARMQAETWFPVATPVFMMSLSPYYSTDARVKRYNQVLRAVACLDPAVRTFVQTTSLPSSMWDSPLLIHMTGAGYKIAGELAFTAYLTGSASAGVKPWVTIVNPVSQTKATDTTLANDKYLHFPMKSGRSYRIRGSIGVTAGSGTPDFKYGWTGPACAVTYTKRFDTLTGGAPTVDAVGAGYPTNKTILGAAAFSAFLEFEMMVIGVSADGEFAFQWAQNTSDSASSGVYVSSYMEFIEIQ